MNGFRNGFTVVEIMVVMGIMFILLGFSVMGISGFQQKTLVQAETDVILTDIYQQRLKAISGDTEGKTSYDTYGVYIRANDYVLFRGLSYQENDPDNFVISLNNGVEYESVTFPGNQIIFASGSGEIVNFNEGNNTFVIKHMTTQHQKAITINRYGVVVDIQ